LHLISIRNLIKGNFETLSTGDRKIVFGIIKNLTIVMGLKWYQNQKNGRIN